MTAPGGKTSLLVVEDSVTQATALRLLLEEAGFGVRVAHSLSDAERALEDDGPSAVLLDLVLPDASGLDGVARIRERGRHVPIIVLTSLEDESLALDALSAGADDYHVKGELDARSLVRSVRYAVERGRARRELAALSDELRALNEQKDRFLGMAAHDLRNPLGVVRGYADFLASGEAGDVNEEQVEILQTMRRASEYMLRLVEDLLDFSRIQVGRLDLEPTAFRIEELVERSISVHRMLAAKKDIAIDVERLDTVGEVVLDQHKIEQVLDNLVTNAIKFSHPGSHLHVRLEERGDRMVLVVRDEGVGIPEAEQARVFAPFEKTSARPTAGERSTGLGLAIVRNIVEAHGGTIDLESAPGRGSTFTVTLPRSIG